MTNKPINKHTVKQSVPNVSAAIKDAAKDRRKEYRDGHQQIEKLKGQIVTTKRTNNTTRVGAIGATAAATLAANMIFLQSGSATDMTMKYGIAFGACLGAFLMNRHFNNKDRTLTEMLRCANEWGQQKIHPRRS